MQIFIIPGRFLSPNLSKMEHLYSSNNLHRLPCQAPSPNELIQVMAAVVSWAYRCLREALHQFPSSRTTRFAQIHLLLRSWFRITPWSPRRIDRFTSNFYPAKEHISETSKTEYRTQGWSVDVCRPCTLSGFFFLKKKTDLQVDHPFF